MTDDIRKIEELELDEVSGGVLAAAGATMNDMLAVMDSLNGKTCKFCKKTFDRNEVWARYSPYQNRVVRQFEKFGCAAVPCLYCDYWRHTTDFE